jgi:hypothetical protein
MTELHHHSQDTWDVPCFGQCDILPMAPLTLLSLASNQVGRNLVSAVHDNDFTRLQLLLTYIDLGLVRGLGTLLFLAAEKGSWDVFTLLLDKGAGSAVNWWANVTLELQDGRYAIHSRVGGGHLLALACSRGNVTVVRRLLEAAAAAGETIGGLYKALKMARNPEIAQILLDAGAMPALDGREVLWADRRVILQPGFELGWSEPDFTSIRYEICEKDNESGRRCLCFINL